MHEFKPVRSPPVLAPDAVGAAGKGGEKTDLAPAAKDKEGEEEEE